MQRSAIQATQKQLELKSKNQLVRYAESVLPTWRKVRVLTDPYDTRSLGNPVAVCEQDQAGKLNILVVAPTLSLAGSFLKVAVEEGRLSKF